MPSIAIMAIATPLVQAVPLVAAAGSWAESAVRPDRWAVVD